jgi:hypothetical protein
MAVSKRFSSHRQLDNIGETMNWKMIAGLAAVFCASLNGRPAVAADEVKLEVHGFVSTSAYYQSTPDFLLNGQGPLMLLNGTNQAPTFGADVRQSRLRFSASGLPVLGGAASSSVIEADFFNLDGPGSYGQVSAVPRLRLAYMELNWGSTILRIGQDTELLRDIVPAGISRAAFPFFGNGMIGWREPGVGLFHTYDYGASKLEAAVQVLKSEWQSPSDFGNSSLSDLNVDYGQLSGLPGLEARVKFNTETATAYLVGHWNRVASSLSSQLPETAVGSTIAQGTRDFDVLALKLGGKIKLSNITAQGEVFQGQNLGPLLGNLLQFPTKNDVNEIGGWLQVGYDLGDRASIWATYGIDQPNGDDAASAGQARLENQLYGLSAQYKDGPILVGPEFYYVQTTFAKNTANAQQYVISANYNF